MTADWTTDTSGTVRAVLAAAVSVVAGSHLNCAFAQRTIRFNLLQVFKH